MGIDIGFGTAFAKSQVAGFGPLPTKGTVFVSVANRDKRFVIFPVKRLADLGFEILATAGTASMLRRHGVVVTHGAQVQPGPGPDGRADHRADDPGRRGRPDLQHPARAQPGRPAALRRLRDPHRRGAAQRALRHHRAGPGRRRAGHRGDPGGQHRGPLAAVLVRRPGPTDHATARDLPRGSSGRVLFRAYGGDAERVHEQTLRVARARLGRVAPARAAAGRAAAPGTGSPVTVAGIEFPGLVGLAAGMDKNGSPSGPGPRSASATPSWAPSPRTPSPATTGRGCSGCRRAGRSSTGWGSTTPAPRRWPTGWRPPGVARGNRRGRHPARHLHRQDQGHPAGRGGARTTSPRCGCWPRTPTTWPSTCPAPTPRACGPCRTPTPSPSCSAPWSPRRGGSAAGRPRCRSSSSSPPT